MKKVNNNSNYSSCNLCKRKSKRKEGESTYTCGECREALLRVVKGKGWERHEGGKGRVFYVYGPRKGEFATWAHIREGEGSSRWITIPLESYFSCRKEEEREWGERESQERERRQKTNVYEWLNMKRENSSAFGGVK